MADLGSDISGISGIDYALSTVSGRYALAQAVLRRLRTSKGQLVTDPSYGYNLRDQIGAHSSASEVQQGVTDQVFAEEEIYDATVDVQIRNSVIYTTIAAEDSDGPFVLTVTSSELTTEALINGSLFWSET